jgi:hypothetical protein
MDTYRFPVTLVKQERAAVSGLKLESMSTCRIVYTDTHVNEEVFFLFLSGCNIINCLYKYKEKGAKLKCN